MLWRVSKVWLMTAALVAVPFSGAFLLLYGAGWLLIRKLRQ